MRYLKLLGALATVVLFTGSSQTIKADPMAAVKATVYDHIGMGMSKPYPGALPMLKILPNSALNAIDPCVGIIPASRPTDQNGVTFFGVDGRCLTHRGELMLDGQVGPIGSLTTGLMIDVNLIISSKY